MLAYETWLVGQFRSLATGTLLSCRRIHMLSKLVKLGIVVIVGGAIVWGTSLRSYLHTVYNNASEAVQESIPLEFELQRARQMSQDITPEIRANMQTIAREEVALQQLQEQIKKLTERQERDRMELSQLKGNLDSGESKFSYGGRTYTVSQVKTDLTQRLQRCKTNDSTLESLQKTAQLREQGLAAARQKLDAMLVSKRQLETEVEALEARMKMLAVSQTASQYNLDDSQLGRVKELVNDLSTRLQVAEKIAAVDVPVEGEIPVFAESTTDIRDEVAKYLGQSPEQLASKE
jgi:chromosome segregation ATPase